MEELRKRLKEGAKIQEVEEKAFKLYKENKKQIKYNSSQPPRTNAHLITNKYIYVLELQCGKYYVCKTINPNIKLGPFLTNQTQWTMIYKPVKIIEIIANCSNSDEDKYTLKCMTKYGVNNVRGGSFCDFTLNNDKLKVITLALESTKCSICGDIEHHDKICPINTQKAQPTSIIQITPSYQFNQLL
jgi:hypothetical protein